MNYYIGIDVGTQSVRGYMIDSKGKLICEGQIKNENVSYKEVFYEQSSDFIWKSVVKIVKTITTKHPSEAKNIKGMGFTATCSLVCLDKNKHPVVISKKENGKTNIIMWLDHRGIEEANYINKLKTPSLKYLGGTISPEMALPKILWIKNNMPETLEKIEYFIELPDFLVSQATGEIQYSKCSFTCKWNYDSSANKWDKKLISKIGLKPIFEKIDVTKIKSPGERAGYISKKNATAMGIPKDTAIGVSLIDAHAGALSLLSFSQDDVSEIEQRLALISGTSNCHMLLSTDPYFVKGVWGPYYEAIVPGTWLLEGGQSAAGIFIDLIARKFVKNFENIEHLSSIFPILEKRIMEISSWETISKDVHYVDTILGNRSPLADYSLKGMASGLIESSSEEYANKTFVSIIQAVCYGTKYIIDTLNKKIKHKIKEIYVTGGLAKSRLLLQSLSSITHTKVVVLNQKNMVIFGAALLAKLAVDGKFDFHKINNMMSVAETYLPDDNSAEFHAMKYKVYKKMIQDQYSYIKIMGK